MAKTYNNLGITVDSTSAFSPQNMMQMWMQLNQQRRANAVAAREETNHINALAEREYQLNQREKLKNAKDALQKWSNKGLDWQNLSQPISANTFRQPIPTGTEGYSGYRQSMMANDSTPNDELFHSTAQANQSRYVNTLINKYNSLFQTVKNQPNHVYAKDKDLYKFMAENYGADELYANLLKAGVSEADLATRLQHSPVKTGSWGQWAGSYIKKPDIQYEGQIQEGSAKPLNLAIPGAAIGFGEVGVRRPYVEGKADFVKQLEKDWKWGKDGLDAKKFKKKYGFTKGDLGGKPGKKAIFEILEEGTKLSKKAGREATIPGQAYKSIKEGLDKVDFKSKPADIMKQLKKMSSKDILKHGKTALPMAVGGTVGGAIGEQMAGPAGEIVGTGAGAYGGWKGFKKVMTKLKDPKTLKSIAKKLKAKGYKSLAAKLTASGVATVVPEGVSTALGLGGLAWSAYDIMKIAQAMPELFEE